MPIGMKATVPDISPRPRGFELVDLILRANRTLTPEDYRKKAQEKKDDWTLEDGLTCKGQRLFVPDEGILRTLLIEEHHVR